jgi:transcriptional regulator with XRE-family HTH domain
MAKATLKELDTPDYRALIGRCLDRARCLVGWSKKELAAALGKDEGQVCRWMDGKERPHLDALFAVAVLRGPLVIALAEITADVDVVTTITVRRIA